MVLTFLVSLKLLICTINHKVLSHEFWIRCIFNQKMATYIVMFGLSLELKLVKKIEVYQVPCLEIKVWILGLNKLRQITYRRRNKGSTNSNFVRKSEQEKAYSWWLSWQVKFLNVTEKKLGRHVNINKQHINYKRKYSQQIKIKGTWKTNRRI